MDDRKMTLRALSHVDTPSNLVLIGMPGAGKSTIGVLLARKTARDFLDTDLLIQSQQQRSLQAIVDNEGHTALRKIEEDVLLGLFRNEAKQNHLLKKHVIATGGSAVYSEPAMHHLKANGTVIFLDVDLTTLKSRINNFDTRGLAKRPNQTFAELYAERLPLYKKYADITVDCNGLNQEECCERIVEQLRGET